MAEEGGLKMSLVQILKLAIIFLMVIALTVGYWGHFFFFTNYGNGPVRRTIFDLDWLAKCKEDEKCPAGAMDMEISFIAIVAIFLLLSAINFLLGAFFDCSDGIPKIIDAVCHIVGGVLVIIAGILMIISSANIDDFTATQLIKEEDFKTCGHPNQYKEIKQNVYNCNCFVYTRTPPISNALQYLNIFCTARIANSFSDEAPTQSAIYRARLAAFREESMFHYKNAAGAIALLAGILYIFVGIWLLIGGDGCGNCCKCGGGGSSGGGGKEKGDAPPPKKSKDNPPEAPK